jgi:hypothetical protein
VSIPVPLDELGGRLVDFPVCLVLTDGDERPHLVAVAPTFVDGVFRCEVGRSTRRNAAAHGGAVTLAFPPAASTGWTLVVDAVLDERLGSATDGVDGPVTIRPLRGVLHRPAVSEEPT